MFASDLQNTQGSAWGRTLPTVARELQAEKHGSAKAPNHYSCQAAPKLFSWQHAATPDLTVVTDAYTTTGHGTGRVLRVSCNFTNPADPWRRLTTSGAPNWPDPVIDFTRKPQFDLYADRSVKVAVGCRETTTAAGTPVGSDGGTSGAIEWAGVTNISGTAPMR